MCPRFPTKHCARHLSEATPQAPVVQAVPLSQMELAGDHV